MTMMTEGDDKKGRMTTLLIVCLRDCSRIRRLLRVALQGEIKTPRVQQMVP
jgi:hypothetical protein